MKKDQLRKKFYRIRKKQYFDINSKFFIPLIKLIKKKFKNKINLSIYYPMSYEVNTLKLLELNTKDKIRFYLPVIKETIQCIFTIGKKMIYFKLID